jgi:hypothetical protein
VAFRIVAILLVAGLADCGKVGSPDIPPGSTYPKVYPALAVKSARPNQAEANATVSSFTPTGAWIDPNMRRPDIDPYADIDRRTTPGAGPSPQSQ